LREFTKTIALPFDATFSTHFTAYLLHIYREFCRVFRCIFWIRGIFWRVFAAYLLHILKRIFCVFWHLFAAYFSRILLHICHIYQVFWS
jgi:hypothetical protein